MTNNKYQICTRCIMDTSDPDITFDLNGVCSNCVDYDRRLLKWGIPDDEKAEKLKMIVEEIKEAGKGREYDCVIGISGGVDSAYLTYIAHKQGLRILAVHVDAGWNSEVAVNNIHRLCEKLNIDLHTVVVDWTTMKELQRAYMFSGLPNLDVPQDHAFISATFEYAHKCHVKYMLNGVNLATEGILPKAWGYSALDYTCIKDVYKKLGRGKVTLKKYPHMGLLKQYRNYYSGSPVRVDLLNYIQYSKKDAMELLSREFGWEYYGGKHFESRFTKFFQSYYLPQKFGYDKKRAHLSSLIVGGEMTREQALAEMNDDSAYTMEERLEDREYICSKLDITDDEWEKIMNSPNKSEKDYKTNEKILSVLRRIKHKILK